MDQAPHTAPANPHAEGVRELPFEFTGNAREYFSIWIVNILLTVATIGLYSAWAKVRRLRYFHGHTALDGHRFAYHGEPLQILKGRLIAVLAFGAFAAFWHFYPALRFPVLGFGLSLVPALIVLSMSFNLRNTALRNLRFSFVRDFAQAYRLFLMPFAVALAGAALLYTLIDENGSFMQAFRERNAADGAAFTKAELIPNLFFLMLLPLMPYLDYARVRFLIGHARYARLQARFSGRAGQFYLLYVKTFGLFILAAGIAGLVAAGGNHGEDKAGGELDMLALAGTVLLILMVFYALSFFIYGHFKAHRTNLMLGGTRFGEHQLVARMAPGRTGWIYLSNTVAAMLSLGLLVPWGKIRLLRYQFDCMGLQSPGLDAVIAGERDSTGALGEEMLDAFDLDLGL